MGTEVQGPARRMDEIGFDILKRKPDEEDVPMSITTGSGDDGSTGLFGGERVSKNHPRLAAYGTVDEVSSAIGMVRAFPDVPKYLDNILLKVQRDLFIVGSDLATPSVAIEVPRVTSKMISDLTAECAALEETLPPLKNFILPTGTASASTCFWARCVVRAAERHVTELLHTGQRVSSVLIYLNRLGDLLFLIARAINKENKVEEELWLGRNER